MKKILIPVCTLICLVLVNISYCQEITSQEREIYYEIARQWHDALYRSGRRPGKEGWDTIFENAARTYGITANEVKRIDEKVLSNSYVTDREDEIYNELSKRLKAMSPSATSEDAIRIHREVADKYGMSLMELHELEYREEVGGWYWF